MRPIDDYSESFPNAAFGSPFKLDLGGVYEIASLLKQVLQAVGDNRVVLVVLSSGEKLQGCDH